MSDTPNDDETGAMESGVPSPPPAPAASPTDGAPPRVGLTADGAVPLPPTPEQPPIWKRIPLKFLIGGGVLIVILIVAWVAGRGKTDATDLSVGDCFEFPSAGESFGEVKDQSCGGLHETEIYAEVTAPAGTEWPGASLFGAPELYELCDAQFVLLDNAGRINWDNVTDDAIPDIFFADSRGWNDGDRSILCYVYSETGLPGPFVSG